MRGSKISRIALASGSKFFLDGIHRVFEDKCNLKVVAKASSLEEVGQCLSETQPEFLLLDNRSVQIDLHDLLDLITKTSPGTKVIFVASQDEAKLNFPNVVYATKKTDSSKIRLLVQEKRLRRSVSTKK
jgi:DNA-binding NarL/FixJ family response regulator